MKVLKGILKESKDYYQKLQEEIKNRIAQMPIGSLKKRKISNRIYYYLQYRDKNRIKHKYLGKNFSGKVLKEITEKKKTKKELKKELEKVKKALKILKKTERKKSVRNNKKNS